MFLTTRKDIKEIIDAAEKYQNIGIVGCASCASICLTGGSVQVGEMAQALKKEGKNITFTISIDEPCDMRVLKEDIRFIEDNLEHTDAIVVLSCGTGVQTISGLTKKKVITGTNSKYIAKTEHIGEYSPLCRGCDECRLNFTGGVCTITLCPKGLLNGPCEGHNGIKCEVDEEANCIFMTSYANMKNFGEEENIARIFSPRDYSIKIIKKNI